MKKSQIKSPEIAGNKKPPFAKVTGGKPRDKSYYLLALFLIMLAAVVGRVFLSKPVARIAPSIPSIEQQTAALPAIVSPAPARPMQMNFSDVMAASDANKIAKLTIKGDNATGKLTDGTEFTAVMVYDAASLAKISASGASVTIDNGKGWMELLGLWVPILMGVVFIWWIFRGMRGGGMGGGIPGKISQYNPTKITTGKTKTTFADVAGIDSEKQEVSEIVDFLKNPEKYKSLGARVPRGVLLSGEPGTGKTLLARAIAGEANVPFFASSGSDFSGIIVGLGVAKIKELFEMARRNSPCILFLDEIDAIGQHRGRTSFNDQDREQTLNQLLIEMDGFSTNSGIIVIGATNRPDMLDTALLRPGRFDRQVYIELPDLKGRREILDLYAKKIKIADNVDLQQIARGTTGFSGADLENLLNEAALHAARDGRKKVGEADLEEARDKNLMGPKKNKKIRKEDIKLTAYHEAGHAFLSVHYRDITDPIHKATIIPRGQNILGMVQMLPVDDKVSMSLMEIRAEMSIKMAGRAAEEVFFGAEKITTGAESDIAAVTRLARYSITVAGMSKKIGTVAVNQSDPGWGRRAALDDASEKTAELVDGEVREWIDAAKRDAVSVISKNKKLVEKLATELLKRETLTREEIEEIVLGKSKKVESRKS